MILDRTHILIVPDIKYICKFEELFEYGTLQQVRMAYKAAFACDDF
jgi:hypothetical protein